MKFKLNRVHKILKPFEQKQQITVSITVAHTFDCHIVSTSEEQ